MCELVAHGIGGHTLAEARRRLSQREVMTWAAYMRKRGPLNVSTMLEVRTAELMAHIANLAGSKKESALWRADDFMWHAQESDAPAGISFADAIKALTKG